jgi:hypothetical protein
MDDYQPLKDLFCCSNHLWAYYLINIHSARKTFIYEGVRKQYRFVKETNLIIADTATTTATLQ